MFMLLAILLVTAVPLQSRVFNNPILSEGNFSQPSMIKVNGTYYITTATYENQSFKFPIYLSTDLVNWKLTGYVFDDSNVPQWSLDEPFLAPRLYKIGYDYHVSFTATDSATGKRSIGVAVAPHPMGPYTATDRPLLSVPATHIQDASVMYDIAKGDVYLIWTEHNFVKGRMLNSNGLSFYSTHSTKLFKNLPEDGNITAPYHISRNNHHYIMYFQNNNNKASFQVSHSIYPLGPYGNHYSAMLDSNDHIKSPGYASLVKDIGDKDELVVFHTLLKDEVDTKIHWVTNLASIKWRDIYEPSIYWPIVTDLQNQ